MPRPHVEYVQCQSLDWQAGFPGTGRDDVEHKLLSLDAESGACTVLVRYPPGWRREFPEHLSCHEELFVLDGAIEINQMRLSRDFYGYLPAGFVRKSAATERGAMLLCFLSGNPACHPGTPEPGVYDLSSIVPGIDTARIAWDRRKVDPALRHMGLGRKVLRDSPSLNEKTLLIMMAPQAFPDNGRGRPEKHPCVEESFLFGGDVISEYGTMRAGAYFWRPPGIAHGPHGSRHGAFMLVRFVEGRFSNDWEDEERGFDPDPDYAPVLPEGLSVDSDTNPKASEQAY